MDFARMDKVAHFRHRLGETMAWCASHDWATNPTTGLRTASLRPPELTEIGEILFHARRQRQQIVEQLAAMRAMFLQAQNVTPLQLVPPLTGGRLLVFNPDGSLSDGAAEVATQGFFDSDNVPAWDTWILFVTDDPASSVPWESSFDSYLLSWVPEALIKVVETGIDWNPEKCILWATDLDTAFIRQLIQAGLIV